jgi:hypothetical protein
MLAIGIGFGLGGGVGAIDELFTLPLFGRMLTKSRWFITQVQKHGLTDLD